jgi:hypothetical protein
MNCGLETAVSYLEIGGVKAEEKYSAFNMEVSGLRI